MADRIDGAPGSHAHEAGKSYDPAQDGMTIAPAGAGTFEVPTWDPVTHERAREALLALTALGGTKDNRFGGDPARADDYLAIAPGWNYVLRLYRPGKAILDGTWKAPDLRPVQEDRGWGTPGQAWRAMKRTRSKEMVTRREILMASCAAVAALAAPVLAQRGPAWEHLGTKEIEGKRDNDKIKCHGKDEYRALQFRVTGAAVQFDRITVEYGNHNKRTYPFRILVQPNGASPVLDLVGGTRDITNVEFWYEKASWGKKPEVRLYGRR